jgi:surface antigen
MGLALTILMLTGPWQGPRDSDWAVWGVRPAAAVWPGLDVQLSEEDLAIIRQTSREAMTDQPEGSVLGWENPESGSFGTVKLLKRFQREGRECRSLRHRIAPAKSPPRVVETTICQIEDGSWRTLE